MKENAHFYSKKVPETLTVTKILNQILFKYFQSFPTGGLIKT